MLQKQRQAIPRRVLQDGVNFQDGDGVGISSHRYPPREPIASRESHAYAVSSG
jgi:hypothetical protein